MALSYTYLDISASGAQKLSVLVCLGSRLLCVMQVLTEIAGETLGQMAAAPHNKVAAVPVAAESEEEEEDAEAADLQARLNAIRS